MPRSLRTILYGALLVLAVGLIAACGGDDDGDSAPTEDAAQEDAATTISVALEDFTLTPDAATASHGEITFAAQNLGSTPHELLVVRTDLAPDALPANGEVDETDLEIVVRLSDIEAGMSVAGVVELEPGDYVLLCNVPGHYTLGMSAAFTLE